MTAVAEYEHVEDIASAAPVLELAPPVPAEAPVVPTTEWVLVDDTWYEVGAPIPCRPSKRTYRVLGQEVIAQSINASGAPKQHTQPIPMLNPAHDQERWSKMSEYAATKDIKIRRAAAEQKGPTAVAPLLGRLAAIGHRLHISQANGSTLLPGEHDTAPGRPSHRIHEVLSEFPHQRLLTLLALQMSPTK